MWHIERSERSESRRRGRGSTGEVEVGEEFLEMEGRGRTESWEEENSSRTDVLIKPMRVA